MYFVCRSCFFVFFEVMVIVILMGVCLFHFYLKKLTAKHRLMIVQNQSLLIELRQKFSESGGKMRRVFQCTSLFDRKQTKRGTFN